MAENDRKFRPRDKEIRIKVTGEELQYAKDKAAYCNLDMSKFIRRLIKDGVVIKYETMDIKGLLFELSKIGTNINQIAKKVNESGNDYDKQDINNIKEEYEKLSTILISKVLETDRKD